MLDLSLQEAQLYRMLIDFFGRERVVHNMSLLAVCGGQVPVLVQNLVKNIDWARSAKCLFTVIDGNDIPRLVVDFAAIEDDTVDAKREEYHRLLTPVLQAAGIRFFTITSDEFTEMLKPAGNIDLYHFFKDKLEELGFNFDPV